MRASAILAVLATALLWFCAAWLWPALPESIPMHFDVAGTPDRWVARTAFNWFLLPVLGSAMALGLAFALPRWIRGLAASNSPYLNVARKREYATLDREARTRAILPVLVMLRLIAAEVALLFSAILLASAKVASGEWTRLPGVLIWPALAVTVGTALLSIPVGSAAVRRELDQMKV